MQKEDGPVPEFTPRSGIYISESNEFPPRSEIYICKPVPRVLYSNHQPNTKRSPARRPDVRVQPGHQEAPLTRAHGS